MKPQPANCGNRYHLSTANAQLHTRTFGQPMGLFYRPNDRKAVGKETGKTNYRRALQQYVEATGVSASAKNFVLFKIFRKSYRCNLVFHPLLQCIITCLALPIILISPFKNNI
jgi:hypothetical protein